MSAHPPLAASSITRWICCRTDSGSDSSVDIARDESIGRSSPSGERCPGEWRGRSDELDQCSLIGTAAHADNMHIPTLAEERAQWISTHQHRGCACGTCPRWGTHMHCAVHFGPDARDVGGVRRSGGETRRRAYAFGLIPVTRTARRVGSDWRNKQVISRSVAIIRLKRFEQLIHSNSKLNESYGREEKLTAGALGKSPCAYSTARPSPPPPQSLQG